MILDSFKLHAVIFQVRYKDSFIVWDRAGSIAKQLTEIWPDLELSEAQPAKQILKSKGVVIETGLGQSTVRFQNIESLTDSKVDKVKKTFDVWRHELELDELKQISTLSKFTKQFSSMKEANNELISLNLVKWPDEKVFDQPMDAELNAVEAFYRFEDEGSFSTIRFKTEQPKFSAELDPYFVDDSEIEIKKSQIAIIFDRGLLGSVNAKKFRVEDWFKGYMHILRRDIEKII